MVLHLTFSSRVAHVLLCICWPLSSLSISNSYWTDWSLIQIVRVILKVGRARFEITSNNGNKINRYLVIENKGSNTITNIKT